MAAIPVFGIVARNRGVRRPNVNRVGCDTDKNDFPSVRLTTPQIRLLAAEYGIWRRQNELVESSDIHFGVYCVL